MSTKSLSAKLRKLPTRTAHAVIDAVVSLPKGERIEVLRSAVMSDDALAMREQRAQDLARDAVDRVAHDPGLLRDFIRQVVLLGRDRQLAGEAS